MEELFNAVNALKEGETISTQIGDIEYIINRSKMGISVLTKFTHVKDFEDFLKQQVAWEVFKKNGGL